MQIDRAPRRTKGVSLTPLIDVVFLLIVFFMLSTSFVMSESLELSMPPSDGPAPTPIKAKDLQLIIRDGETIQVGNQLLNLKQLDNYMFETLSRAPMTKILILSTPKVSVQELVSVMDIVYLGGGQNVQIDDLKLPAGTY